MYKGQAVQLSLDTTPCKTIDHYFGFHPISSGCPLVQHEALLMITSDSFIVLQLDREGRLAKDEIALGWFDEKAWKRWLIQLDSNLKC